MTSKTSSQTQYEPVIDGLRALAVLSVMLFHFEVTGFTGGFIGVDIFFVISGFLITRNITLDINQNKFTFKNFYIRRARRIFPAMFFTMLLVAIFGAILFSPVHLERLGSSIMHASFAISNIFFWQKAGYWDTMKDFKPLLHFWSLAVEEQFYLFWPALLAGIALLSHLKNTMLWIILTLSLASLILAEVLLRIDASAAFYLMPTRIFEFGLGATLVWINSESIRQNIIPAIQNFISVACLSLIIAPVFFYTENSPFPGLLALAPCLGACGLILMRQSMVCQLMLGNKFMVGIGLISYSLYLVHWPVFVFYKYIQTGSIGALEVLTLTAFSIASATFMYFFIEQPFRKKQNLHNHFLQPKWFYSSIAVLLILLFIPAHNASKNDGWTWRVQNKEISYTAAEIKDLRTKSQAREKHYRDTSYFKSAPPKFIVIGDSYARDFANSIEENEARHPIQRLIVRAGCLPLLGAPPTGKHPNIKTDKDAQDCVYTFNNILKSKELENAEIIMLGASWLSYGVERLTPTIKEIRKVNGAPIIIFGRKMMFKGDVPTEISKYGRLNRLEEYINAKMRHDKSHKLNNAMKAEIAKTDAIYIDAMQTFCPNDICPILIGGTNLSIIDDGHWSLAGAKIFGQRLKESNKQISDLLFK